MPLIEVVPDDGGTGTMASENPMQQKGTTDDTKRVLWGVGKNGGRMMDLRPVAMFDVRRLVEPAESERPAGRMRAWRLDGVARLSAQTGRLTAARSRHSMGGRLDGGAAQGIS